MEKNRKIILISSILLVVVIILGIVGTYAWYVWSTGNDETTKIVTSVGVATITYDAGSDLVNQSLKPVSNKTLGIKKDITVKTDRTSTNAISFNLYLDINTLDNSLKHGSFKYELYNGSTLKKSGDFSQSSLNTNLVTCATNNSASHIVLLNNEIVSTTSSTYTLYIWIDGANYTNPDTMQKQNFSFTLHADGQNAIIDNLGGGGTDDNSNTLINYIRNLYTSGNPELITQNVSNDSYYYSYQDTGKTWGIMNDGLKVASTSGAGATTITDAAILQSGTQGNLRFFGPSASVNNYIYFNCDTYPETGCEKWRIIGIVDGKVKIRSIVSIGSLAWDHDKNQGLTTDTYSNNWQTSSLKEFLNGLYYNRGTTSEHTYLSGSDGSTQKLLDLEAIGITAATRDYNLILASTWYLGGYSTASGLYPNDSYNLERTNTIGTTILSGNPFTVNALIGLFSPSDYGYGVDLTNCTLDIFSYDTWSDDGCVQNNWLGLDDDNWFITPSLSNSNKVMCAAAVGGVIPYDVYDASGYGGYVYPTLYLNPDVIIESGHEGTSTDPYRISLS